MPLTNHLHPYYPDRRKVLKHHPDKLKSKSSAASKASGKPLSKKEEDSFFKCIQRAWEILSDPIKRRQFDSCDPSFDEKTPSTLPKSANFYKTFGAAFERNSHFSKVQPVPSLGDENTPREQVEGFYNFWFNFDSWRTFEWEDEEDKESAESREDKRWLEKKNKAQRAKRKQEDNRRISTMVESAMKFDPRLAKFKEEDRYAKDAKKREREEAERKKKEDAQRKLEEEAETKAREEAEAKAREDEERKGRKAAKEAQRKGRKAVKRLLEEQNYFLPPTANATEIYAQVTKMEAIFEAIGTSIADLELFKQELTNAKSRDAKLSVFTNRCNNPCSAAPVPVEEPKQEPEPVATPVAAPTPKPTAVKWTPKDLQLLTKSIKLFPGGTVERWEKIADYLSHHTNTPRTSAECIKISKQIQSGAIDPALLAQAFVEQENLAIKSRNVTIADPPTVRTDDDEPKSAEPKEDEEASEWSPVQQAQLEAALKEFPAGMFKENPADRWDKIAACVEGKSKKEVKLRMKELADLIKKKKQQA